MAKSLQNMTIRIWMIRDGEDEGKADGDEDVEEEIPETSLAPKSCSL